MKLNYYIPLMVLSLNMYCLPSLTNELASVAQPTLMLGVSHLINTGAFECKWRNSSTFIDFYKDNKLPLSLGAASTLVSATGWWWYINSLEKRIPNSLMFYPLLLVGGIKLGTQCLQGLHHVYKLHINTKKSDVSQATPIISIANESQVKPINSTANESQATDKSLSAVEYPTWTDAPAGPRIAEDDKPTKRHYSYIPRSYANGKEGNKLFFDLFQAYATLGGVLLSKHILRSLDW